MKSQCFAQLVIRSAACRVWCFHNRGWKPKDVNTSESETVPTGARGMPHTAVGTVDGRNIQTLFIRYNPLAPKFNVNVTWSALAPMDERNQTPNITFGNTRAKTLKFWGAEFNIVRVAGFEYFVHLLRFMTHGCQPTLQCRSPQLSVRHPSVFGAEVGGDAWDWCQQQNRDRTNNDVQICGGPDLRTPSRV